MKKYIKTAVSTIAALCIASSGITALADFSDVDTSAYYAPYVNMLTDCAVLSGRGDGSFDPNAYVTRAELAKIAVIMSDNAPSGGSSLFGDIQNSHWAASYVNTAAQKGFITGYTDGSFRPEKNLTYAEAVTVALRMLGYTSSELTGGYPYAYINKAAELGLTAGLSFSPDDIITRGDTAYIFGKAFVTDKKSGSPLLEDKGYSLSEECTVLSSYGISENEINTTIGSFTYGGDKSEYIGARVKLVTDGSDAAAVLPVRNNREGGIITGISGSTISYFDDGEIKTVQLSPSANVYFQGAQSAFSSVKQSVSTGDAFYYTRTKNGGFDYGVVEENDNIVPAFGAEGAVYGSYTVKNSKLCFTQDIKPYDAVYYYPSENLSLIYSSSVSGVFQSAYPNKENASSITVGGTEYSVDTEAAQAAVSALTINDTVTVALGRNGGAAAVFKAQSGSDVYGIERVIGDNIICRSGSESKTVKADDTWRVIYKGKDTTFGAVKTSVGENMQITFYYDGNGGYDYSVIEECKLTDAVQASENGKVPFDNVRAVIRDGKKAAVSDIKKNDILYYNSAIGTVYAYCDSVSGIYEDAYPNADNPSSVKISGKIYEVETVGASYALSDIKYETAITVYLGRNGAVAAVGGTEAGLDAYGVITDCTEKTVDGKKDYYVTCLGTGGEQDFKVSSDKSDMIGRSIKYRFEDGYLTVSPLKNNTLSGSIDRNNRKIGNYRLTDDCVIIDVGYVPEDGAASAKKVELSDIARSSLSGSDILAFGSSENGLISFIALNNVTKFDCKNGITVARHNTGSTYKIDTDGVTREYSSNLNISCGAGAPVTFRLYRNKLVELKMLTSICSGSMTAINGGYITLGERTYDMTKDCAVYVQTDTYEYKLISADDADDYAGSYAQGWSDVPAERGGSVRVVVIQGK